jgi:rhombotail lipoprotein
MNAKVSMTITAALALALTGCETFQGSRSERHASSLVQYLYPKKIEHIDKPGIPTLTLPLRVGVAFVPEDTGRQHQAYTRSPALSEQQKLKLLTEVSEQFRKYPFVRAIEVIPSEYLTPAGGFENLDQLRNMFGVDVMALVSYDQLQFTDDTPWSLTYLTVVGAFFIPGEKNDTRTMIDAAVYDIESRKLLFRAPGLNHVNGNAAPINVPEELRDARDKGFREASKNLTANLEVKLAEFRERIKQSPEEVKIVRSAGYVGGAGMVGIPEALAVATLTLAGFAARRRQGQ